MRLIAGKHRGRRLTPPPGLDTRPTADRARQALFNILSHGRWVDVDGARVVDVFAGSGALGLEALSRGAAHVTFVDQHAAAIAAIRQNVELLREQDACTILRHDATRLPVAPQPCDLALLDAPYQMTLSVPCLLSLQSQGWLAPHALTVIEVAAKEEFIAPSGFQIEDERIYGAARFVFLIRSGVVTPIL